VGGVGPGETEGGAAPFVRTTRRSLPPTLTEGRPIHALGIAARFIHLAACVVLVGSAALLLVAGRSDRPTALAWQQRIARGSVLLVVLAVGAGLAALGYQTAIVSGQPGAALDPAALLSVLLDTHAGRIWLARHILLVLVGAFVVLGPRAIAGVDWLAVRGELVVLAALALGLVAAAGHAAAVTPDAEGAMTVDVLHVLATGIWVGGLLPLGALLARTSREDGADARPYAVLAARRFSRIALACVVVLILSGAGNAIVHIGGVPAVVGTAYGRLLLLKLAILVPILLLGVRNQRALIPRLSGEAVSVGRPAMRALARSIFAESALALTLLAVVAVMGVTPPGRHEDPSWPFSFRLTFGGIETAPDLRARVLIGSQVMVLGVVAILCAALLRGRRLAFGAGAIVLLAFGSGIMLPPLAVDAYPTTYQRPAVPYQAASIAEGAALFQTHCARCHGRTGAGDGPERPALPRPPADLRSAHTAQHTAGDLYWWITAGIPHARMPAFGPTLTDEQRWDLVNFARALGSGDTARRLGPGLVPPALVAPDFTFAVGPTPPRALKDYRGRRIILLVLYTLPTSHARLGRLAERYDSLVLIGVEVIAVPRDASPDAIRQLGDAPRILFPVVTGGAGDIVAAYDLFARAPHTEFLIDRQGYLRARWAPDGPAGEDVTQLFANVQKLNEEKLIAEPADEHAH
jgi:putative copper export protein/mono/diheme cytochrome c family protein/peroxiredoxin